MALDTPSYDKKAGNGLFWRFQFQQFGSMFIAALFYAFLQGGARAAQPLLLDPGDGVLYGLAIAAGFLAGTLPFIMINGGFIFFEVMVMGWIIGLFFKFFWTDVHDKSDQFYKAMHPWTILFGGIFGLGLGSLVGYLLVWAIFGSALWPFVIFAPGPWPGFQTAFSLQAFAFEAIAGFVLTFPIYYLYLKDKAQWIPVVGALINGAVALFGFSVSGGAFTIWSWTSVNIVSCFTPTGCFPGDVGSWWWGYSFGMWTGATIAAIFAYTLHLLSDEYGSLFAGRVGEAVVPYTQESVSAADAKQSRKKRKDANKPDLSNVTAKMFGPAADA